MLPNPMEPALLANNIRSPAIHQMSLLQRMPSPPAWQGGQRNAGWHSLPFEGDWLCLYFGKLLWRKMSEALTSTLPKYPGVRLFQQGMFAPIVPCAFVQWQPFQSCRLTGIPGPCSISLCSLNTSEGNDFGINFPGEVSARPEQGQMGWSCCQMDLPRSTWTTLSGQLVKGAPGMI